MPIGLREPPEPTCVAASGEGPQLAECEAFRRLKRELERYVRRETMGRSLLIAGHRGAGKTTLVLKAYEEVSRELAQQLQPRSPVLVRLQGKDFVPSQEEVKAPPEAELGTKEPDAKQQLATTPRGRALRQITQALYRAVAERFAEDFLDTILSRRTPSDRIPAEDLELAASFRLALDEAPPTQALRDFYRRGGFLDSGVLWRNVPVESKDSPPVDQGMRELVALASAARAYRLISGTQTGNTSTKTSATDKRSRTLTINPAAKETLQALFGLLLGGLVGAGVLAGDARALPAGIAAAATAAAAFLTLKVGSERLRHKIVKEEGRFTPFYDDATLERELPILVRRLHEAGLAPMFMVDELDKVPALETQMLCVIDQLKAFVSERAFFCFLTDRDYFEQLGQRLQTQPYPKEHTYFSDRLFVLYRPEDLHRYLTGPRGGDQVGDNGGGQGILELVGGVPADGTAREVLPYLLLHRAKMHPADLQRELQRMRDPDGFITLSGAATAAEGGAGVSPDIPGALTTDFGYKFAIALQMAIELLLQREDLRRRIDQDPNFAQPAYDALYYVSRTWESGRDCVDLSEEAVLQYLDERTAIHLKGTGVEGTEDGAGDVGGSSSLGSGRISIDRLYHRSLALALVELILNPPRLLREIGHYKDTMMPPRAALDAIPIEHVLLKADAKRKHLYSFCFDAFGRDLGPAPADLRATKATGRRTGARVARPYAAVRHFVLQLDEFIRHLTGSLNLYALADELAVLSTSPAWPQVEGALGRMVHLDREETYSGLAEDISIVDDYISSLCRRGTILTLTLVYGAALAEAAPESDPVARRASAIRCLATSLGFSQTGSEEELRQVMEAYGRTVRTPPVVDLDLDVSGFDAWKQQVEAAIDRHQLTLIPENLEQIQRDAWARWRTRVASILMQRTRQFAPHEEDLLCQVAGRTPGTLLRSDLGRMSLADWSRALRLALADLPLDHQAFCPSWLGALALTQLNFDPGFIVEGAARSNEWIGELTELMSWAGRQMRSRSRPTIPLIVIFASPKDSLTESWIASRRWAAVTAPQARERGSEQLADLVRQYNLQLGEPALPLIEVSRGSDPIALLDSPWRSVLAARPPLILARSRRDLKVFGETRLRELNLHRSVTGAKSLDDAVRRALGPSEN